MTYRIHTPGELSPNGLLDVGIRCVYSCRFCIYSHFDNHPDRTNAMRSYPWRSKEDCLKILGLIRSWGLTHVDLIGGEPSIHPDVVELVQFANQLGLIPRLVTLGQSINKRKFDALLEAGLRDWLISVQGVTNKQVQKVCGSRASFDRVAKLIERIDEIGMPWKCNCQAYLDSLPWLVDIAKFIASTGAHTLHVQQIKLFFGWNNNREEGIKLKARYSDVAPLLVEVRDIMERADKVAVFRETPYCVLPETLWPHVGNLKQNPLDVNEERNGTRGTPNGTVYGDLPFLIYKDLPEYYRRNFDKIHNHPDVGMVQGEKCQACSLRGICDGVDKTYVDTHGWSEFKTISGSLVCDPVHFARQLPKRFEVLE